MAKAEKPLSDLTKEQLIAMITDQMDEASFVSPDYSVPPYWPKPPIPPVVGPFPWPPICPTWPPICPVCGFKDTLREGGGIPDWVRPVTGLDQTPQMMRAYSAASVPQIRQTVVSNAQIQEALLAAMRAWKPRFADVTLAKKLASLTVSGSGRMDIISAVRRARFFQILGVTLSPPQMSGDVTLGDVADTLATLIDDLGHVVTP